MVQKLFFIADGVIGREPYVTDGSSVMSLGDINPGAEGSNPGGTNIGHAVSFEDRVLFVADDGEHGAEFWTTDGTIENTRMLVDFAEGALEPEIRRPALADGLVWFNGGTPETGKELHVTDGTAFGTRIVIDLNEGTGDTGTFGYTEVNGHVVFTGILPTIGAGLWVTDGTDTGTRLLSSIFNSPGEGALLDDVLYFNGGDASTGAELWRTDGTEAGTFLVADINPDEDGSHPQDMVSTGGKLFFTADDGEHGDELWVSDGTGAGSFMVRDINSGPSNPLISGITTLAGKVLFTAVDQSGRDLWVSDGTFGGTVKITTDDGRFSGFTPVGDGSRLVFFGQDGLWVTDGTTGGTSEVVAGLDFGGNAQNVGQLVYFDADDGENGNELWVTDGTTDGTRMVADMTEGPGDTDFDRFTVLESRFIDATEAIETHDLGPVGTEGVRGTPAELDGDRLTQWDIESNTKAIILLGYLYSEGETSGLLTNFLLTLVSSASLSFDIDGDGANETEITFEGDFSGSDFRFAQEDGNTVITTVPGDPATPLNLLGTPDADVLEGRSGNDRARSLDGSDRVLGHAGNDTLEGGDGNDTLNGGDGNDVIKGGETEDDLRDVIFGGAGNDDVDAGYGNDQVFGQEGNDTIAGGFGADELQGQDGNDVITGGALSDLVFGGSGDDFVNGGFGYDRINGGDGADRFFHLGVADHGSDWLQDYDAAEGDVLVFGQAATADQFQINLAHTATPDGERSGDDDVQEAFVIYRPTGQIMWALVDGEGQEAINLQVGGEVFDLLT